MASRTEVHKTRKKLKQRKIGVLRKKSINKNGSTPTDAELFGEVPNRRKRA